MSHILSGKLKVTSHGKSCPDYRGCVKRGELGAIIVVEQPINGRWVPSGGSWYISSLLEGGVCDSISIDWGQDWRVTHGMIALVNEALAYCADQFKKAEE